MKDTILLIIVIFLSFFLNHKIYGNSNSTISNIERLQAINHSIKKTKHAKIIADYMYIRIKYYQKFDTWYERLYALEMNYEALQNMDLDKE